MTSRISPTTWTALLTLLLLATPAGSSSAGSPRETWTSVLHDRVSALDDASTGNLGVYALRLSDGTEMSYDADRSWYLSSTTKVPVAIAVLQKVEAGQLRLEQELTLQTSDYVDGAGSLLWAEPGTRYSLQDLVEKMLRHSDSTATDMLIRLVGEDELNARVASMVPGGFGPITTLLQVRYDVYSEIVDDVETLSNMDIVRIQGAGGRAERWAALLATLGAAPDDLKAPNLETAFERYYARGINGGTLEAFGTLLQRLVEGDLLSPAHTALLLGYMEDITTGDHRIRAGLSPDVRFAQKTGTQIGRACNVGVLPEYGFVVTACVEKYDSQKEAESVLRGVGEALMSTIED